MIGFFFFWLGGGVLAAEVPCCVCVCNHLRRFFWDHTLTIRLHSCRSLKNGRKPQERGLDQVINKVVVKRG